MDAPSEHLRTLAHRIVSVAAERIDLRAALLAGSAGRGDADYYSDVDLPLYVDDIVTGACSRRVFDPSHEIVNRVSGVTRAPYQSR